MTPLSESQLDGERACRLNALHLSRRTVDSNWRPSKTLATQNCQFGTQLRQSCVLRNSDHNESGYVRA
jgi:hypothetical protein